MDEIQVAIATIITDYIDNDETSEAISWDIMCLLREKGVLPHGEEV